MKKVMRSMLSLLLLASYVPLTGVTQAQAANSPSVFILNDDLESRTLGVIPSGYSSLLDQSNINNLTVVNTKDVASRTNSWYTPGETAPASNISPVIPGNS